MRPIKSVIIVPVLVLTTLFGEDDVQAQGKQIYLQSCAVCHGLSGKGDGVVAGNLAVKPRDFTSGKFKVRTTRSGQVPLDEDIYRTLGKGMGHDNAMPAWSHLRSDEKEALVQYLKTFAPKKFARQQRAKVVPIPNRKLSSVESITVGQQWFMDIECWKCHGQGGHADGPSTKTLQDTWGNKIVPPDLSKPWLFIGGSEPEDIYRTLRTGLTGSAMPTVDGALTEDQTWDLVNFLLHEFIEPGEKAPR